MKRSERVLALVAVIVLITFFCISIAIKVKYNGIQFRLEAQVQNNITELTTPTYSGYARDAMAQFTGKWKLEKSDNFDNFLKELGVNFMLRKMANTSSPTVEISNDGDSYEFKTITSLKTSVSKFTLGQEFEEERLDGKKVKSVITLDGNKLIQVQKDNGKEVTYVREFNGDTLTVTSTANGVVCVRIYKRQG